MRVHGLRAGVVILAAALVAATSLALGVLDSSAAGEPPLLVSSSADRAGAVPLQGAALTGQAYVFVAPPTTPKVLGVDFYIDSAPPATPSLVEAKAPYDLRGGTSAAAIAWDTSALSPGVHTVTAVIRTSTGQQTSTAQFTTGVTPVPTTPPATTTTTTPPATSPPPSGAALLYATTSNRAAPSPLAGAAITGATYIFVTPAASPAVTQIAFYLDGAPPAAATRIEKTAPYDLFGGTATAAVPWNSAAVPAGTHSVTALVTTAAGSQTLTASFSTGGATAPPTTSPTTAPSTTAPPTTAPPTTTPPTTTPPTTTPTATAPTTLPPADPGNPLIHLSWNGDAATTFTVTWRAQSAATPIEVRYRRAGTADAWLTTSGALKPRGTGSLRTATVGGLAAGQSYEYQVRLDAGWSAGSVTRTVSPTGPVSFVYLADTGIIGRTDGLAAGTSTVLANVAQVDPQLILGGGDYAYYNTDKRWPTLDGAIDAWFSQMQPLTSRAPLQPAYGNHEVLLGEGFGAWADRFTTPTGVAGKSSTVDTRGTYSYDVGPVHFVSIMAVDETAGLPSANRTWITNDITAAKARGARWIIPYMHGVPLGDGTNHQTNFALQSQLGPLFESLDVPLVMFSHDQSFERSYPLTGVKDVRTTTPRRTSTSMSCYTDADGPIWIKTSPGGKLSSKNADFSQFLTTPQAPWTAVRGNTDFHFTQVTATATSLTVTVYGIAGAGQPRQVLDTFVIKGGSC